MGKYFQNAKLKKKRGLDKIALEIVVQKKKR
jgi:hypothetical protein